MTYPSDVTVQTWIRLIRAYNQSVLEIEKALSDSDFPPLSWYDMLLELERAGNKGLRQFELEHALLLKQYSVSRLVEKIEKKQYLKRETSKEDGRGKVIIITEKGKELRQRMWRVYGPKMEAVIGQKLSSAQCHELKSLLGNLIS
ncbi:MAG: MarR family winged helix-turn-helix transcriptional regulator [Lentilitoribacter sp.]